MYACRYHSECVYQYVCKHMHMVQRCSCHSGGLTHNNSSYITSFCLQQHAFPYGRVRIYFTFIIYEIHVSISTVFIWLYLLVRLFSHAQAHIHGWNARAATVHRAVTGHPIRCIQTKISTKPVQITFASALSLFSSPRTPSFEHGLVAIDLIYRTPAFLCDFR